MTQVTLTNLVAKLSPELKQALEVSAGAAMNQNVPSIETEHWLLQLLSQQDKHLNSLIQSQNLSQDNLVNELSSKIARFPKGNEGQPTLSQALTEIVKDAWMIASVNYGHGEVISLHLIQAMLQQNVLGMNTLQLESLQSVSLESLQGLINKTAVARAKTGAAAADGTGGAPVGNDALSKYTTNLTQQALDGNIDPISGRNSEVRKAIDILCRKRQNNPIMVGEPGVGKTAVVEGLALRIAANEVPGALQGVQIHSLDLGLLQAGASVKGEFENRLKDVINEVKNSEKPIIVFIDEAHTLIGAGGAAGQNDAANLLKPALARGEFKTIAATTWAEYKKYFEKDPALTRRFQVVSIEEPNAEDAKQMLRGIAASLQKHHGAFIAESAIDAAVHLSIRYLPSRQLPDKAISLLDTASARIALTQGAKPEVIEALEQTIRYQQNEKSALEKENALFGIAEDEIAELTTEIAENEKKLTDYQARWKQEVDLVDEIKTLQQEISDEQAEESVDKAKQDKLNELIDQLGELQGEEPLVNAMVDDNTIAQVIANWTGIPVGNMMSDEIARLLSLEEELDKRVIGQNVAKQELAKAIRISRAGLTDSRKPIGVFLMCGPSGVGKTETAMALAEQLYGGSNDLTVINMTEFKEEHKISMLLGSPAGYVGFGEGGVLTEAIRRNPYSVLLLDEMEKAHPGVHDLFYQIFDKGHIKDSEGRTVDFKNTIIIMTSNAADQAICDVCADNSERLSNEELLEAIRPDLQHYFKPAFLGRTTIVPYYPLNDEELAKITEISLNRIKKKLAEQYQASFTWDEGFVDYVVGKNTDPTTGGRAVEQIINRSLMPKLAEECISRLSLQQPITQVSVTAANSEEGFELTIQ
ncbi:MULTISPECIES: type VI secretion system ATPase TssH [Vibrio]|jgi:type VI secretion system protein VasG|uniref:Type VI secretion system ATPase TssH n=1 Tax=Vibrio coralliilyticus TaxID=190893 RepID=A0AAP7DE65_9VIBR|nr:MULTISPECIES: type VI secretion system ATPase TssH [Vibrio]NOI27890.1 type VI secretion system ATPase TssH [Vibrio coralliilyticus]NOI49649.1 type VI secretion system ATPase TssH [Vibrio coralliilyticus]NOI58855.1 type VI secretion system ATPase TssH [Vibrio coralliilyticus]NOJ24639.1 type VI secretion system ATPase TssH [Vibrio coralliilyticus]PAT66536.1 ClpV1 family T6SS ATPase [Vibrio coralliilyticus]